MTKPTPKPTTKPRTVEGVRSSYQPSRLELNADSRGSVSFEEAVKALTEPVKIRWIDRPKRTG